MATAAIIKMKGIKGALNLVLLILRKIQVSQVTSGPRRGPTFNNRWWNDRRS